MLNLARDYFSLIQGTSLTLLFKVALLVLYIDSDSVLALFILIMSNFWFLLHDHIDQWLQRGQIAPNLTFSYLQFHHTSMFQNARQIICCNELKMISRIISDYCISVSIHKFLFTRPRDFKVGSD